MAKKVAKKVAKRKSLVSVPIKYLVNDPTTPTLTQLVKAPDPLPNSMGLNVVGWDGKTVNSVEIQAANVYVTLTNICRYTIQQAAKVGASISKWAAVKQLKVFPRKGQQLNAYYDRYGLNYFFDIDQKTGKLVYAADSTDVVSHECGHALLDAQRPDFWSVQALEIWSFHEAYADITALCSFMLYDNGINFILDQTKGNINLSNTMSKLAEQLGRAIYDLTEGRGGYSPNYLRDATIAYNYVAPSKLPANAPDNQLAAECHSFGRVFLSAWYDILSKLFEYQKTKTTDQVVALKAARDVAFTTLLNAVKVAPRAVNYYNAVANAMLGVVRNQKPYFDIMQQAFVSKNIISNAAKLEVLSVESFKVKGKKVVHKVGKNKLVRVLSSKTFKLGDLSKNKISAMVAGVDLNNVEIEVATDSYCEFDGKGKIIHSMVANEIEALDEARRCISLIQGNKAVSVDQATMWNIKNNKLVRSFID